MRNGNVFVVVEHDGDDLRDVTLELLGDARSIATKVNGEVWTLVLTASSTFHPAWLTTSLAEHGASRVLLVEHPLLETYLTEAWVEALAYLSDRFAPALIMAPATIKGQDYAPRLAARLDSPFASDCTSFKFLPDGRFAATRAICGGKAQSTVVLQGEGPFVVSLRPDVAGVGKSLGKRQVEVERITPKIRPQAVLARVVEAIPADPATVDVAEAEVVVAGGKGVGGREEWARVEDLARLLNGSVGASRVAVDLGWAPYARQVGQSGKSVSAKLYVACGISGASQHLTGMQECEAIIAINTDRNEPIMKVAHLGLVGDMHQIIPALADQLRDRQLTLKSGSVD